MKYKVGDKLKMKSKVDWAEVEYNDMVEVIEVEGVTGNSPYSVESKLGYRIWVEEEDLEPLTNIIEVSGKKYEECSEGVYNDQKNTICIEASGEFTFYKKVKEEFKTTICEFDVKEVGRNILQVGCSKFVVSQIENLLEEYKEYLKQ